MKTALGMIVKDFNSSNPMEKFLLNAKKYKHDIDKAIILVCSSYDEAYVEYLNKITDVILINANDLTEQRNKLKKMTLSEKSINALLGTKPIGTNNMLPYGYARNIVLLEAVMCAQDELIFVDSDVLPEVLICENGEMKMREVDFVGEHLKHLRHGSMITTSEYSGYNILPPACFEGMNELLIGLGKENMAEFWRTSASHNTITFQDDSRGFSDTNKVLGGNCGFRTEIFKKITPFFSSYYECGQETFLSRGEDTSLSEAIKRNNIKCTDINVNIFHNTYENFPKEPDLKNNAAVQNRFFYACMGWIGRNPFYDYLRRIISNTSIRRTNLTIGVKALVKYTSNEKFMLLNEAFELSGKRRTVYIEEYRALKSAWKDFVKGMETL